MTVALELCPALFFLAREPLPPWLGAAFVAFWAAAFALDAGLTASCGRLATYEQNLPFRAMAKRLGVRAAVFLQAAAEACLVVVLGYGFRGEVDSCSVGIISLVFGLGHASAWMCNRRFLGAVGRGAGRA